MYETFFGLRERPFDLTPNPRYLLLTATHREALANLEYGIAAGTGLTLLIGDPGTGKTTLLRRVLSTRVGAGGGHCVYLNNPTLTRAEFYAFLTAEFGLGAEVAGSKAHFLAALGLELQRRHLEGISSILVLDEAQSLPDELLEEIRLLANIETDTAKLLPLILAGQPELADRLNQPGLRQLKQRVALRCHIAALTLPETASYVAGRIRLAGGDAPTFMDRDAVLAIFDYSRGIPRTISVIADNALMTAFAAGERRISASTIHAVARDFDLVSASPRYAPAAPVRSGERAAVAPVPWWRRPVGWARPALGHQGRTS